MKLILGSSSKYRKSVLKKAGYRFGTESPDIDEKSIRSQNFRLLPLLIAQAKQQALLQRISGNRIIITADQVIVCNGMLHEKPRSEAEVWKFFDRYSSGHSAMTISAVMVVNTKNLKVAGGIDIAEIFFKPIPEGPIHEFVATREAFYTAGAFTIESKILRPYIKRIKGTEDSIKGMPLKLLRKLLRQVS